MLLVWLSIIIFIQYIAPSIVNGVTDFTITGKLKNTGSQDVHVVRDPSGILYEFFTADALDIKKTDSEERDTAKPSFVGYRASWDMKTYLENNIEEDEYLPDDHPDVVSLSEDSESESHAKRGSSNSGSVESDTLSDTDTSITGSSKSGDITYPPGTTFHLTAGQTISFDYKGASHAFPCIPFSLLISYSR